MLLISTRQQITNANLQVIMVQIQLIGLLKLLSSLTTFTKVNNAPEIIDIRLFVRLMLKSNLQLTLYNYSLIVSSQLTVIS